MTRKEAIRRMECCRDFLANNYSDMGEPNVTAFNMAIKALEQEPCEDATLKDIFCMGCEYKEQEPKNEWISVGEMLPENFQRVLVTAVNYDGDKVVRVAEYYGRQRIFQIKENHDQWKVGDKGLLAWRELPEPYKESEE